MPSGAAHGKVPDGKQTTHQHVWDVLKQLHELQVSLVQEQRSAVNTGRHLTGRADGAEVARAQHSQQRAVDEWLANTAQYGTYRASNASSITRSTAASNNRASLNESVPGALEALLVASTTRQPQQFTLQQMRLSVLTLAGAVAVATLLQGLGVALWRLLQLNPTSMPA